MTSVAPRRARAVRGSSEPDPAQALRTHLIEVTQRLLAEHGLTGLTTRRIAQAADVSDGVLYNHFADKDALVMAALTARFSALVTEFDAARPQAGTGDVRDNLTRLASAALSLQTGLVPLVAGLLGRPDLFTRFFTEIHAAPGRGPQHVMAALGDYVRAEQDAGRAVPDVEADVISALLFGVTMMLALASHVGRFDPDADGHELAPVVDFLARGVVREP